MILKREKKMFELLRKIDRKKKSKEKYYNCNNNTHVISN